MDPQHPGTVPVRIAVLAALALIICALALWAAYQWYGPLRTTVDEARTAQAFPDELRGAFLVEQLESGAFGFHKIGEFGFEFVPNPGRVPPGAMSPDGTRGTNAVRAEGAPPSLAVDTSAWTVNVFSMENGDILASWNGYAPAFLDDTHVAYFDATGVSVRNLDTNESVRLTAFPTGSQLGTLVQYSPDRSLVMWADEANAASIVARISPTSYEHKGIIPHPANLALFNTAVYELRPSGAGMQLWRHGIDGENPHVVATLPERLRTILLWP